MPAHHCPALARPAAGVATPLQAMARMWWPALVLLPVLLLGMAGPARADEADEAYYRRASACTAVLKREVVALRDRFLRGDAAVRPEIQRLTEQSFTFVGIAYKRGLRNPQADRLLDEAEAAQQRQPAAALRQLFTDCQAEGAKLLSGSNAIERALVRNRAKARVEQLLTPPARTG